MPHQVEGKRRAQQRAQDTREHSHEHSSTMTWRGPQKAPAESPATSSRQGQYRPRKPLRFFGSSNLIRCFTVAPTATPSCSAGCHLHFLTVSTTTRSTAPATFGSTPSPPHPSRTRTSPTAPSTRTSISRRIDLPSNSLRGFRPRCGYVGGLFTWLSSSRGSVRTPTLGREAGTG